MYIYKIAYRQRNIQQYVIK